jgi:hypothetical protein
MVAGAYTNALLTASQWVEIENAQVEGKDQSKASVQAATQFLRGAHPR